MTDKTLEDVYERLAEGIDQAGEEHDLMFMSKVALLLANELNDPARVIDLIEAAELNMMGMRRRPFDDKMSN